MATNFPGSVDDASTVGDGTHPSADEALSSTTGGPAHHALHQNVGLAINAIEDKVGTGSSTAAANTVLTGTGSGTSAWATVSTAMIGDDQVTQAKIADDAVGADQLAANAVVTASIVDDQVTQAKIGAGAVGTTELGPDAVNGDKIADDAVAAEHLATDSVTADAIAANAVDTAEIKNNAVTADKIANDAVGNDQLIASPTFTNITGTLLTNAQTNITSVGTLDDLTVTGVIDANGVVKITDGTVGSPSLTFDADEDTGIFRNTSNQFALVAGGQGGLIVAAGTVNTAGPEITSTSGFNAVYRSNAFGTLFNFSSRAELKENIANVSASDAGAWIDALQPVTFNERWMQEGEEPADNKAWREADSQVGFIADDVFANPTTARFATVKDEDGTLKPVSWRTENVLAAVVAELKSVRARLEALEG